MAIAINGHILKRLRLQRAWSQQQLAEISGISERTIQRLEQSGAASHDTAKALSAALNVSVSRLTSSSRSGVRRITPMTILNDIGPALRRYLALGFSLVENCEGDCVGVRAGDTTLILVTSEFLAVDYGRAHVASLIDQTIPYIWVDSIDAAKRQLGTDAAIVFEVPTRCGTIEMLVREDGQHLIFAETIAA